MTATVKRLDWSRDLKPLYTATRTPVIVEVPPMRYLAIDGCGDLVTAPAWTEALQALYGVAFALKFALKRGSEAIDYKVMPRRRSGGRRRWPTSQPPTDRTGNGRP